ncbi:cell division protein FtsL [Dyella sp. A6]|uniref:cell division protein FtsL n=1 Tax=Dyella aluminiiresistens TaxID=3069105 RepID=UPI002E79B440|nr:cell division protein FtsL [Dyella sp. A6]
MKVVGVALLLMLLGVTMVTAIGVVWTRQQSRALFMQLTQLQNRRDALNIEYNKLELEQATWAEPRRIDSEARSRLGMLTPLPQDIRLVTE